MWYFNVNARKYLPLVQEEKAPQVGIFFLPLYDSFTYIRRKTTHVQQLHKSVMDLDGKADNKYIYLKMPHLSTHLKTRDKYMRCKTSSPLHDWWPPYK